MAILFVTHKFPPSIGGMQKQSYELINGVKKYSKVFLIAQSPVESKLWFFLRLRSRIKSMIKRHPEIRILHCNDGVMAAFVALFVRIDKVHFSCTYHGLDLVFPNYIYQKYIIPRVHNFSAVFCVSQYTADQAIKRGFSAERISYIPNGVDFKLMEIDQDDNFKNEIKTKYKLDLSKSKIILSVGRAVKRKGFSWFINNVLPDLPKDVKYLMIGPIEKKNSMTSIILSLLPEPLSRSIQLFTGFSSDSQDIYDAIANSNSKAVHLESVEYSELLQFLSCADVFVMPNLSVKGDMEGFGLVALEANLRNCPVVVSPIEGISSAVENKRNGIYARTEDKDDWIVQLNRVFDEAKLRKNLILSAKEFVKEKFSWDDMAENYYGVFKLLDNARKVQIKNDVELIGSRMVEL